MFGEWISVKDRMPEVSGTYLVYLECGAISIEKYHNSPDIFQDEFEDDYEGPGFKAIFERRVSMTFYEKMAVIMYVTMMLMISLTTCLYSSGKEKPAFAVLCLAVTLSGMLSFLSIVN